MYGFLYGIVIVIAVLTIISEVIMFMTEPSFWRFITILVRGFLISVIFIALAEIYSYVKSSYHFMEDLYSRQKEGKQAYPEIGRVRSQNKEQEEWKIK